MQEATRRLTFAMLAGLAAVACSGGEGGGDDTCSAFPPWQTGDDGADVSIPPPGGQARAGRIRTADAVPHGLKNQAQEGDVMLRNGRVLFVIEDDEQSDGYQPFGGGIVFADLVGPDGEPQGRNNFGESFHGLSISLLEPDSVTVLADGSDGGEAVVRVVGEMRNMPLLDVAFSFMFVTNHGARYILDYVLGPDSSFLEIRFHIRNPHPSPDFRYVNLLIFGAIMGDGQALFTPEGGFDLDALSGAHDLYGHVGEGISYAWMDAQGGRLRYVMEESKILVGDKGADIQIERCSEVTVPVIRLLVTEGGAEALLAGARRVRGEEEPPGTQFLLSVQGGGDPSAARVHVTTVDGAYVTSITRDAGGAWTAGLEPGDYLATVALDGHPAVLDQPFAVTPAGASVDVTIPQAARVTTSVADGDGSAVPAKIMFFPDAAPAPLPPGFGEKRYPLSATVTLFDPWAAATVLLPPGGYSVVASRGYEYEIDEQEITAEAGSDTTVDLVIEHAVDSTGMLCGDFHVHSEYSPDSSDTRGAKVSASAAEGVEILASTDHEWTADYQVDIEAEGLQAWVHGVPGEELTTYDYGHFNVYPQTIRTDRPNQGAIDWYYRTPPDVFGEVHSDPLEPVLQINHPRSSTSLGGYFNACGFDPVEGTLGHPDMWYGDFEAVEVWNGDDFRRQEEETVVDWFALIDMGLRFAAMGNSDTHELLWSEIGYPRSCLLVGHDEPVTLTNVQVRDAVKAMRVIVSGGILVTAQGPGGEGPGEIADAPSGTADIHVRVQAPTWVSAERLRVFVGGEETATITLDGSTADPSNPAVRFDDVLVIATPGGLDGWVVFVAEGDATLDPVTVGQRPFGVTNPIFLDADGDGSITPRRPPP